MEIKIYALIDPRNDQVRYIGKTQQTLGARLSRHLTNLTRSHKSNWIRSLKKENLKPTIEIIDLCEQHDWPFWERHYISLYKSWGFKLTNGTAGGEESPMLGLYHRDDSKLKISLLNKGRVPWNKGIPHSDDVRRKISIANKGKVRSEEYKRNTSKISVERWADESFKQKESIKRQGVGNGNYRGAIEQLSKEGEILATWESLAEIKNKTSFNGGNISSVITGKLPHAYGFLWRRISIDF